MQRVGVDILFSASEMAVVGITEALVKIRIIFKALQELKSILKKDRPDLLILIDYPGFNIHIARTAKQFHVPVLYYVSPQVWAWRTGRVKKIARRVDHMAAILPFEKAFYAQSPLLVDYVGHPLLDSWPQLIGKEQAMIKLGIETGPVVGLLPGSRKEEINNLFPIMVRAAEILKKRHPGISCLLPLASTIGNEFVQIASLKSPLEIKIIRDGIHDVLSACDIALVASGTATLETAIMGVPMVIVYRMSAVTYWYAKMAAKVPFAGLVNLVAGEEVVPELIQNDLTEDRLAQKALTILEDRDIRLNMIEKLKGVKKSLGQGGAADRTAKIALEMMR